MTQDELFKELIEVTTELGNVLDYAEIKNLLRRANSLCARYEHFVKDPQKVA